MRKEMLIMMLGMLVVTFIPRLIPALFLDRMKMSPKFKKFLQLIPFTAMTCLVFPGVFSVDSNVFVGIIGIAVATILAYRKMPVIVCVLASISCVFLLLMVI